MMAGRNASGESTHFRAELRVFNEIQGVACVGMSPRHFWQSGGLVSVKLPKRREVSNRQAIGILAIGLRFARSRIRVLPSSRTSDAFDSVLVGFPTHRRIVEQDRRAEYKCL